MRLNEDNVNIPEKLINAHIDNRLVIFVGAGISAKAFPGQKSITYYPTFYDASTWKSSLFHSGTLKVYFNGGTTVDTGITLAVNTDYHIRIRLKNEVADGNNGIVQFWYSTTDPDFDGDTANYELTTVDTNGAVDFASFRLRGPQATYISTYDDVMVWETP